MNTTSLTRLNKRMAELGLCSRREADDWIDKGWVYVNKAQAQMGMKVSEQDVIEVKHLATQEQDARVTILLNKPVGYVSAQAEDGHTPAIALIQAQNHWSQDRSTVRFHHGQLKGLAPAGRLDIDSVGLLVLTQDGRVARQLIGEDSDMEKEYLVRVQYVGEGQNPAQRGYLKDFPDHEWDAKPSSNVAKTNPSSAQALFPAAKLALLRHGLSLEGQALRPAGVEWQNPDQLRFVLKEGKKRQIRRMCELVGLSVVGLKRIRMGQVSLGALPTGQWRYLGAHERF